MLAGYSMLDIYGMRFSKAWHSELSQLYHFFSLLYYIGMSIFFLENVSSQPFAIIPAESCCALGSHMIAGVVNSAESSHDRAIAGKGAMGREVVHERRSLMIGAAAWAAALHHGWMSRAMWKNEASSRP
jgi:hypothetical protein